MGGAFAARRAAARSLPRHRPRCRPFAVAPPAACGAGGGRRFGAASLRSGRARRGRMRRSSAASWPSIRGWSRSGRSSARSGSSTCSSGSSCPGSAETVVRAACPRPLGRERCGLDPQVHGTSGRPAPAGARLRTLGRDRRQASRSCSDYGCCRCREKHRCSGSAGLTSPRFRGAGDIPGPASPEPWPEQARHACPRPSPGARRRTVSSIAGVNRQVNVFCWLGSQVQLPRSGRETFGLAPFHRASVASDMGRLDRRGRGVSRRVASAH